jgi:GT2 family glycosyltransferase
LKVACIFLTLDRPILSIRCIDQNFHNSGLDADVFLIDNGSTPENLQLIKDAYQFTKIHSFETNKGIAAALNKGIELAEGYGAIVTLANDILMPDGWLINMVEYASRIPDTGIVGIHCVENLPPLINGVHVGDPVFGNVLITRALLDKIGRFNTDFDPYGMQDADYGYRAKQSGFVNYYLPNLKSKHIGHDVGDMTAYRRMKDEGLAKSNEVWRMAQKRYEETKNYFI